MNKILAGFFAFLLWIMPWSTGIYNAHARYAFDANTTWSKILKCVETHDAATLESMMSPRLKNNVIGLSDKIEQLLDSIDMDCGYTRIVNNSNEFYSGNGIYGQVLRIGFVNDTTKKILYTLEAEYDITNASNRSYVGISRVMLSTGRMADPDYATLILIKMP